ncbi:MAG: ABC transporter substrate-binding protein [Trebonia sp.]
MISSVVKCRGIRILLVRIMFATAVVAAAAGCGSAPSSPSSGGTASSSTGSSSTGSASSGPEQASITVDAIKSVTAAGLYLAEERGYFTDAGLRVTVVPVTGTSAAIPDLLTNHVQVIFGAYVAPILAQSKGAASLRFIAAGNVAGPGSQEVVVLPGSPISSPAGLRGKTIGVNSLDDVGTLMIDSILSRYGIPSSAVHYVDIPFPEQAAALAAHRIDAAYLTEPFLSDVRKKYGARTLFDCDQGAVADLPIAGFASTSAWAARNPRTVAAFVSAVEKGQTLADSDRSAVNAVLSAHIGIPVKTVAGAAVGTYPVGEHVQTAPLQRLADLMLQYGLLKSHFNIATMVG